LKNEKITYLHGKCLRSSYVPLQTSLSHVFTALFSTQLHPQRIVTEGQYISTDKFLETFYLVWIIYVNEI